MRITSPACAGRLQRPTRSRGSYSASRRPATTRPAPCSTRRAGCSLPSSRANWTCIDRSAAWCRRRRRGNTSATGPRCRRRRSRRRASTGPAWARSRRLAAPASSGRSSSGSLSARRSATRSACRFLAVHHLEGAPVLAPAAGRRPEPARARGDARPGRLGGPHQPARGRRSVGRGDQSGGDPRRRDRRGVRQDRPPRRPSVSGRRRGRPAGRTRESGGLPVPRGLDQVQGARLLVLGAEEPGAARAWRDRGGERRCFRRSHGRPGGAGLAAGAFPWPPAAAAGGGAGAPGGWRRSCGLTGRRRVLAAGGARPVRRFPARCGRAVDRPSGPALRRTAGRAAFRLGRRGGEPAAAARSGRLGRNAGARRSCSFRSATAATTPR